VVVEVGLPSCLEQLFPEPRRLQMRTRSGHANPWMEDVRHIDDPAAQRDVEGRGDTHSQQRTEIVCHNIDGPVDPP
jgi:hypothetical protein